MLGGWQRAACVCPVSRDQGPGDVASRHQTQMTGRWQVGDTWHVTLRGSLLPSSWHSSSQVLLHWLMAFFVSKTYSYLENFKKLLVLESIWTVSNVSKMSSWSTENFKTRFYCLDKYPNIIIKNISYCLCRCRVWSVAVGGAVRADISLITNVLFVTGDTDTDTLAAPRTPHTGNLLVTSRAPTWRHTWLHVITHMFREVI